MAPTNNPNADEIVQQRHIRAWTQRGGPRPNNKVRYAGPDEQYMTVGDVANPVRGGTDPVWVHDPRQRGLYRLIGRQQQAPDLPSSTISFMRKHGGISWIAGDLSCPQNFYELAGDCDKPDNFLYGWTDFLTVYSYGLANDRTHQGRTAKDEDEASMDEVQFTFACVYDLGTISFGEVAQSTIEREAVDGVFWMRGGCQDCGRLYDFAYVLTKSSGSGSPGTPAEIHYVGMDSDGRPVSVWNQTTITGMSVTNDPVGIDIVGNYLVVLDSSGYWYAELNPLTGQPSNWQQNTSGFVAAGQPQDILVLSSSEFWIAGKGGYLYRGNDPSTGVTAIIAGTITSQDFLRIDGFEDTIVAVGALGQVVRTLNRGGIWATTTVNPTSGTLRTVQVLDQYRYWVGSGTGGVWWTIDGGESWTQLTFNGAQVIDDIAFATDEVGWISMRAPNASTAKLWSTYNGGYSWSPSSSTNPRIQSWPTFTRANRLAVPTYVQPVVAANRLLVAGLSGGGTDGIAVLGLPNVK